MSTVRTRPVCIIGAGPYGLSIAAHLSHFQVDFRIFGSPIHRWLAQMPKQMLLKSESCASSLYAPGGYHNLAEYCKSTGIQYPAFGTPVSRELFAQYAMAFQQKIVPNVENVRVTALSKSRGMFALQLSSGEIVYTDKVIVATGNDYMAYIPDQVAQLPAASRSHTADHYDLSSFKGKEVAVLGGGQSALETAAILRDEGASVTLVARRQQLAWNPVPPAVRRRSLYERIRSPRTRFGDGLAFWIYDRVPGLFHFLPRKLRIDRATKALGPAGAWWLKERVIGQLPILLGHQIVGAEMRAGRAALLLEDQNGRSKELLVDHIIAGTGYRFNIQNLPFLDDALKRELQHEQGSPIMSTTFEYLHPRSVFYRPGQHQIVWSCNAVSRWRGLHCASHIASPGWPSPQL